MPEEPVLDLPAFVARYAPMAPHRAALFVASLAEQLADRHVDGLSYGTLSESVRVEVSGGQPWPLLGDPAPRDGDRTPADDVRQTGVILARLLGVEATGDLAGPVAHSELPAPLWRLIVACLLVDPAEQPTAAILARELRVAGRDLLLGVAAPGGVEGLADVEAGVDAPAYVPSRALPDGSGQLSAGSAKRRRWVLGAGLAVVLVVALGAAGYYHEASQPSRPRTDGAAAATTSSPPVTAPTAANGGQAPVGNGRNLLSDPGAEQSPPGWTTFGSGVLSQVTTHRSGSHALRITTNAVDANSAGAINRPVQATTVVGRNYQASCWVRSAANIGAFVQVQEYTSDWKRASDPARSPKVNLEDPSRWYQVSVVYAAKRSGNLLPLVVFSNGLRAGGAELLVDDCSLTEN